MSAILSSSLSSSIGCVHNRAHKLQSLLAAVLGLLLVEMICENSPVDFEQHLLRQHLQAHECHSEQQSQQQRLLRPQQTAQTPVFVGCCPWLAACRRQSHCLANPAKGPGKGRPAAGTHPDPLQAAKQQKSLTACCIHNTVHKIQSLLSATLGLLLIGISPTISPTQP